MKRRSWLAPLAWFLVLAAPGEARAAAGKADLGIEGDFGLLGTRLWHDTREASGEDALVPDHGFGLRFQYEVWRYLDVGAQTNVRIWGHYRGRYNVDLAFRIAAKFPLTAGGLELTLAVPVGFTVAIPDQRLSRYREEEGLHLGAEVGGHVAVLAGLAYPIVGRFGGFFETGWVFHSADYKDHDLTYHERMHRFDFRMGFSITL